MLCPDEPIRLTAATYSYTALDQLTATGAISGVAYNSDGDQTSITGPSPRGTVDLTFDGRHQATGQTAGGVATSWAIDGEERVTRQTKAGVLTRYRYVAPGDGPAWEEDSAGTITASMINGPSGVLATYSGGTATFPVVNGHGDVIQIRNASGGLGDTYSYDDSGEVTSAAKPTRYGYVGQWQKDREEDSSMIRMGARMYDPLVGRFASWDPVDGGDFNPYTYAGQNPINNYDLDGEAVIEGGSGGAKCKNSKCRQSGKRKKKRQTASDFDRFLGAYTIQSSAAQYCSNSVLRGIGAWGGYGGRGGPSAGASTAANAAGSLAKFLARGGKPLWAGARLATRVFSFGTVTVAATGYNVACRAVSD